jgi:hypothetical protein
MRLRNGKMIGAVKTVKSTAVTSAKNPNNIQFKLVNPPINTVDDEVKTQINLLSAMIQKLNHMCRVKQLAYLCDILDETTTFLKMIRRKEDLKFIRFVNVLIQKCNDWSDEIVSKYQTCKNVPVFRECFQNFADKVRCVQINILQFYINDKEVSDEIDTIEKSIMKLRDEKFIR